MKTQASKSASSTRPARQSMVVPAGTWRDPSPESPPSPAPAPVRTASDAFAELLVQLGVTHAFGLMGGAIVPFASSLARSPIAFLHFRHETGAAFAAVEASLATGRPVVVVVTTGPGLTNVITGIVAARWEGARVILISAATPAQKRGRWAFQDTSAATFPASGLFSAGPFFHFACMIESPCELEVVASRLASGMKRPSGFVAHISLPVAIQNAPCKALPSVSAGSASPPCCDLRLASECAQILVAEPFVVWVGFGARNASQDVRQLTERTGAMVMCSPRGKGIFPEDHPQFLGVTGLGGHSKVQTFFAERPPKRVLVLGSRLGELTSFWSDALVPKNGFIHVDVDPDVFGAAYPAVPTIGVHAEIEHFVRTLVACLPPIEGSRSAVQPRARPNLIAVMKAKRAGLVRPTVLMDAVQRIVVQETECIVLTEAGNSFAFGNHYLRFSTPGRYRVSTGFGSMGHAAAGVLGAALGSGHKAFAIVGDGSMLMQNEINTAVQYGVEAVWIILNDARYNMIEQGMRRSGYEPLQTVFPPVDFVAIARGLGADGVRVDSESELDGALSSALRTIGPFLIDVAIDPDEPSPFLDRVKSLMDQESPAVP